MADVQYGALGPEGVPIPARSLQIVGAGHAAVTAREPSALELSDVEAWAERGFCKRCGTTLFYFAKPMGSYLMSVGAFDDPERFREMLADRGPWAAVTVLIGIFALLFAFTGSVLIPLRTIATTLLSLGAALGVVVWVFQDGHLAGLLGSEELGSLSLTAPPLIIAIAFGLAMDYELFILARMREARAQSGDDRAAVVTGLRRSGFVDIEGRQRTGGAHVNVNGAASRHAHRGAIPRRPPVAENAWPSGRLDRSRR